MSEHIVYDYERQSEMARCTAEKLVAKLGLTETSAGVGTTDRDPELLAGSIMSLLEHYHGLSVQERCAWLEGCADVLADGTNEKTAVVECAFELLPPLVIFACNIVETLSDAQEHQTQPQAAKAPKDPGTSSQTESQSNLSIYRKRAMFAINKLIRVLGQWGSPSEVLLGASEQLEKVQYLISLVMEDLDDLEFQSEIDSSDDEGNGSALVKPANNTHTMAVLMDKLCTRRLVGDSLMAALFSAYLRMRPKQTCANAMEVTQIAKGWVEFVVVNELPDCASCTRGQGGVGMASTDTSATVESPAVADLSCIHTELLREKDQGEGSGQAGWTDFLPSVELVKDVCERWSVREAELRSAADEKLLRSLHEASEHMWAWFTDVVALACRMYTLPPKQQPATPDDKKTLVDEHTLYTIANQILKRNRAMELLDKGSKKPSVPSVSESEAYVRYVHTCFGPSSEEIAGSAPVLARCESMSGQQHPTDTTAVGHKTFDTIENAVAECMAYVRAILAAPSELSLHVTIHFLRTCIEVHEQLVVDEANRAEPIETQAQNAPSNSSFRSWCVCRQLPLGEFHNEEQRNLVGDIVYVCDTLLENATKCSDAKTRHSVVQLVTDMLGEFDIDTRTRALWSGLDSNMGKIEDITRLYNQQSISKCDVMLRGGDDAGEHRKSELMVAAKGIKDKLGGFYIAQWKYLITSTTRFITIEESRDLCNSCGRDSSLSLHIPANTLMHWRHIQRMCQTILPPDIISESQEVNADDSNGGKGYSALTSASDKETKTSEVPLGYECTSILLNLITSFCLDLLQDALKSDGDEPRDLSYNGKISSALRLLYNELASLEQCLQTNCRGFKIQDQRHNPEDSCVGEETRLQNFEYMLLLESVERSKRHVTDCLAELPKGIRRWNL